MSIIAVSDVHLGYSRSNSDAFNSFLDYLKRCITNKEKNIESVVICGDLLDMWRRDLSGVAIESALTLIKLKELKTKTYYVVGNHDFHLIKLGDFQYPFEFCEEKSVEYGGKKYCFKHGYEFEPLMNSCKNFFDMICLANEKIKAVLSEFYEHALSGSSGILSDPNKPNYLLEIIKTMYDAESTDSAGEFAKLKAETETLFSSIPGLEGIFGPPERRKKIKLNKKNMPKNDEVLVFGHTHAPFINIEENVVNLGSWVNGYKENNNFLEIEDGKLFLYTFQNDSPKEIKERLTIL